MRKITFFYWALCFLLCGCMTESMYKEAEVSDNNPIPGIIVRATTIESVTGNTPKSNVVEPVVFTENELLWFNETTKEIRFKDNIAMKGVLSNVQALKFYLDSAYLFSSIVILSSVNTQVVNSLAFYYNNTENKYYLLDGYPLDTSNLPTANDSRGNYMLSITSEWNKFIDQLKKDAKHRN